MELELSRPGASRPAGSSGAKVRQSSPGGDLGLFESIQACPLESGQKHVCMLSSEWVWPTLPEPTGAGGSFF